MGQKFGQGRFDGLPRLRPCRWRASVVPAKERVKKSELRSSGRLRSVITAKEGIHLSSRNKPLHESPPSRGRRRVRKLNALPGFAILATTNAGPFSSLPVSAPLQGTRKPRLRLRYLPVPARSAIRARLSLRPSTCSTSKMGGEVVRPVSAARKGWATPPSLAPASSA